MPQTLLVYDGPTPEPHANTPEALAEEILEKLIHSVGKDPMAARRYDWLHATILTVRDRAIDKWMESTRSTWRNGDKRVYYMSLEFLIGRLLRDAICNLELMDPMREALNSYGVNLDDLVEIEPDAALGNGGLGRLAAGFLESMSSVQVPAYGYGIRYQNGLFRQETADGWQVELPENWLAHGNSWEFERRESAYEIGFGGRVNAQQDNEGVMRHTWVPAEHVNAVAFDTPVVGWRGAWVNTLRLWSAQAIDPVLLDRFNKGDHIGALEESAKAESITLVLYPADDTPSGQELRLRQEFFFSSASLQDIVRRHLRQYEDLKSLPDKVAIQLNDTHPSISVVELMRILVDIHHMGWDEAWDITVRTFSYTNHTLLPEALETWPVAMMERLLPRHMQIIYAINAKVMAAARGKLNVDDWHLSAISLINENDGRRVRMGPLSFVGAHSVNGVSALHTELMKQTVFDELNNLYPGRINNKTNGITPRRWLMQCNPGLTKLIRTAIGPEFLDRTEALEDLRAHAGNQEFQKLFMAVKRENKVRLAREIMKQAGIEVSPDAMFDVHIKRIHEYKRQLLNIVEAVAFYEAVRAHPEKDWVARVKIFAGKAAPSYWNAKLIIKLINDVAKVVNNDPAVRGLLKIVFMPNYNVSLAEKIIPAADLSEQVSTAGMEASGTGNMKLALNGALTIGTLDGANVEIRNRVGADNIVIFGLTSDEVAAIHRDQISPGAIIAQSLDLRDALNAIAGGVFSPGDTKRYKTLINNIHQHDWFMVARDFASYARAQRRVDDIWGDQALWAEMAINNVAGMGWFSSDRAIRQYAKEIWNVPTASAGGTASEETTLPQDDDAAPKDDAAPQDVSPSPSDGAGDAS